MKMTPMDIHQYPKLKYYVKYDLPRVINIPSIVSGMARIGSINKTLLRKALAWNKGPTLKITHLNGAFGEFTPYVRSNEISLDTNLVIKFENCLDTKISRYGNVYLTGVTILHELVHWGDDQNGIDRQGEEGEEFERFVYGRVIN